MKSSRFLPVIVPIIVGLLIPTVAFYVAQYANGYVPADDGDLDEAVARAASGLPLMTILTIPGFLGLAAFLFFRVDRFGSRFFWTVSLVGSLLLAALVLRMHAPMYDLLYSRGRMHSTTGIGIMFISFYCIVAAGAIVFVAQMGHKWWSGRSGSGG